MLLLGVVIGVYGCYCNQPVPGAPVITFAHTTSSVSKPPAILTERMSEENSDSMTLKSSKSLASFFGAVSLNSAIKASRSTEHGPGLHTKSILPYICM